MAKWILTDASTGQHVIKSSDKLDTFHFVDTIILSSERYAVISDTVSLETKGDYDVYSHSFAELFLHPYGYTSFEALCKEYGKDAKRIAAECVFETLAYSSKRIYEGSFENCQNYIASYIGKDEAK